jgi:serine/threonine protein kinase
MELCDGCLHSYLKNRTEVDPQQSFNIISQLIDGIHYLHSHGIVHRDLKPGNILLNKSNSQVKIGDFGLAALIDRHEELSYRERVGTPLYIAPELNGKSSISKDQMFQVDIFSLGVIYFELLTLLHESTQHERSEKLSDLQLNKVHISAKDLKEEKKFIKLLTKTMNRPTIYEVKESKEYQLLKEKYRCE